MKKTIFFSILLISLFSFSCSEDIVNEKFVDEGINFFLLKDSTITTNEIMSVNLNDLTLADKSILSYKDFGGIRNEENFVIIADGYKLLGKNKPKTIEDVEKQKNLRN